MKIPYTTQEEIEAKQESAEDTYQRIFGKSAQLKLEEQRETDFKAINFKMGIIIGIMIAYVVLFSTWVILVILKG